MSLPPDAPRPRLCHLIKSNPEQEYGFDLHAEKVKGQFIGNVDDDSPAGTAGLRRGDRIVAVNGSPIGQENHKDIVQRIKDDPMQCRMVVLDEEGLAWYNERKLPVPIEGDFVIDVLAEREANVHKHEHTLSAQPPPTYSDVVSEEDAHGAHQHNLVDHHHEDVMPTPERVETILSNLSVEETPKATHFHIPNDSYAAFKPRPRLCKLKKVQPTDEYGFNLHAEKSKGHFIGKVDNDSIAERAGLEEGQRIVGVNNTLIYPNTPHKDVVSLIKQNPSVTELLVVFPEIDNWYRQKEMEFSFDDAETTSVDEPSVHKPLGINGQINGNISHVDDRHSPPSARANKEEVNIVASSYAASDNANTNGPTPPHKEVFPQPPLQHEESKHHGPPPEPVEPKSYEGSSAPVTHQQHSPAPAHDAPGAMFNLSAAQMKEYLLSKKKADPRKSGSASGDLSLRQKYDIIQSL